MNLLNKRHLKLSSEWSIHQLACYIFTLLEQFPLIFLEYYELYNNQIDARALIGQSAVGYCAGKPGHWIIARLLNYYIKAIDHKFL